MGDKSAIQWTDATWNPLAGCTPVSDGCRNCYAASMALRLEAMGQEKYRGTAKRVASDGRAVFTGKINLDRGALEIPLKWKKPRRIFVNSMSDLFHEAVPDHFILEVFAMMERCPQHIFQVLTKRPARMAEWVRKHQEWVNRAAGEGEYLRRYGHVWVGTSVEHQQAADERIPHLLRVPARVRFLSCEPLLGPIDLTRIDYGSMEPTHRIDVLREWYYDGDTLIDQAPADEAQKIHWIIAGGESGHGARPCWPDWARCLRDQCQAAQVPYFWKQWGEYEPYEEDAQPPFWNDQHGRMYDGHGLDIIDPETGEVSKGWHEDSIHSPYAFRRVGKHAAGRLLDGVEHNAYPA